MMSVRRRRVLLSSSQMVEGAHSPHAAASAHLGLSDAITTSIDRPICRFRRSGSESGRRPDPKKATVGTDRSSGADSQKRVGQMALAR